MGETGVNVGEESIRPRIARNLREIRDRIHAAAGRTGRDPEKVQLIAVTKLVGPDEIRALQDLGLRDFGENRVDEALGKRTEITGDAAWHMIGRIQRRKARDVVAFFDYVHSVDRVELAEALQRRCDTADRSMPVLLEVNASGEASKAGFEPDALKQAVSKTRTLDRLDLQGLMTMAPLTEDESLIRPVFARVRKLAEDLGLPELSMGMSNDFEIAVEEGATQVRIGSALYRE
jgi:PLP dependent protein